MARFENNGWRDRIADYAIGAFVALLLAAQIVSPLGHLLIEASEPSSSLEMFDGTSVKFKICDDDRRINCVVDGDTFWFAGRKIRIIDMPELYPPRCAEEARLGMAAQQRLLTLLNAGPFELVKSGRDVDQYRRSLRLVMRDGQSLGAALVGEHLARPLVGRRDTWC